MGYVDSNLVANEKIVMIGKVHWGIYIPGAIWFGLGIMLLMADTGPLAAIFLLTGLLLVLRAFLYSYSTELAITDKRVIAKFGLVRRQTIELLHTKVEGLNVDQGILGRILDFGTVVVNGTGAGRTPIRGIAEPLQFRKAALAEIEAKA